MSVRIGLVGTGTVGGGCIDILRAHADEFRRRYGVELELVRVCSLVPEQAAAHGVSDIFTMDYHDVVEDPSIQVVIELIGGVTVAKSIVCEALERGKHVVTANKALMASCGREILSLAQEHGCEVAFEASVGGGIPILGPLMHSLVANDVSEVTGIVNGTTNYMLTRMANDGMAYEEVLAEAQRLGFAEADPTADVDGFDAAAKIAILASIAFDSLVTIGDVHTQGIRSITPDDLAFAREEGLAVKLAATARRTQAGIEASVQPVMIAQSHPLAGVSGVMNAIYVVGDFVGETMFYGAGAGSGPAASAVMGDVVDLAQRIERGATASLKPWEPRLPLVDFAEQLQSHYVRFAAGARPGACDEVRAAFEAAGVELERVSAVEGANAPQVIAVTKVARACDVQTALQALEGLDAAAYGARSVICIQP